MPASQCLLNANNAVLTSWPAGKHQAFNEDQPLETLGLLAYDVLNQEPVCTAALPVCAAALQGTAHVHTPTKSVSPADSTKAKSGTCLLAHTPDLTIVATPRKQILRSFI